MAGSMKRIVIIIVVLVGLSMSVTVVQGTPRMTLPETEFNFGFVPQNSKVSHVFWVHSTGDEELKILRVKPG
jgi:hypothetical protein